MSDAELIARFVSKSDMIAFEILVRRHGPMVLGVCRRVLRHEQDAEDAFQAAFLVLHRKAHAIRGTSRLANWLYGVAYRTALKTKSARHNMRTREMQVECLPESQAADSDRCVRDLEQVLDLELSKLAEKYRLPIVLCELEGMSLKEAARQLRLPEGTLSARLSRGRSMLRDRLERRGMQISMTALGACLAEYVGADVVKSSLLDTTIRGATLLASGQAGVAGACSANVTALTKGVLKSMFLAKLKYVAATAVVTTLIGTGVIIGAQDPGGSTQEGMIAQGPAPAPVPQAQDAAGGQVVTGVVIFVPDPDTASSTNGDGQIDTLDLVSDAKVSPTDEPAEESSSDEPVPTAIVMPLAGAPTVESLPEMTDADKVKLKMMIAMKLGADVVQQNDPNPKAVDVEEKMRIAQERAQANEEAVEEPDADASDDQ